MYFKNKKRRRRKWYSNLCFKISFNYLFIAPKDAEWANWGSWGSCSRSCGEGVRSILWLRYPWSITIYYNVLAKTPFELQNCKILPLSNCRWRAGPGIATRPNMVEVQQSAQVQSWRQDLATMALVVSLYVYSQVTVVVKRWITSVLFTIRLHTLEWSV